jgi:hypothetical protein
MADAANAGVSVIVVVGVVEENDVSIFNSCCLGKRGDS